ncbi:deoxyribonuclease TATDN1-like isoform X2 [Artemia franciscana]
MYIGIYGGNTKHPQDLMNVLQRSWDAGVDKIIITGGSLSESKEAIKTAHCSEKLFATVGCHPTRCSEFEASQDPKKYFNELQSLVNDNKDKVVAIGECGLDYERTQFCIPEVQKKYFEYQLELAKLTGLPLFLHNRKSTGDLLEILKRNNTNSGLKGVVHSFDGSYDEAKEILMLGFDVGINGCSLKTEENLQVAALIPEDRLHIETDSPWCEIRPTHAGFKHIKTFYPSVKREKWNPDALVKSRNEPCQIRQVLEILSCIRSADIDMLADKIYQNSCKMFFSTV